MHSQRKTYADRIKYPAPPTTLDSLSAIAPCNPWPRGEPIVRSEQIRTKHRNRRQAILSESAHTLFVYARSMRAVSMLCSLRPLLASSIIAKPGLLPVGFAGLRHLGRWLCHRPFFCLEYGSSPFQDAEVA